MIRIYSNGSKWAGEEPDSIETLLEVLEKEPLNPRFEKYGGFITRLDLPETWDVPERYKEHIGEVRFDGNFQNISHCFEIDTDELGVIEKLTKAIRKNQETPEYQSIKKEGTGR